jgi:hypothetical protein
VIGGQVLITDRAQRRGLVGYGRSGFFGGGAFGFASGVRGGGVACRTAGCARFVGVATPLRVDGVSERTVACPRRIDGDVGSPAAEAAGS